jgi:hypothetical protein
MVLAGKCGGMRTPASKKFSSCQVTLSITIKTPLSSLKDDHIVARRDREWRCLVKE